MVRTTALPHYRTTAPSTRGVDPAVPDACALHTYATMATITSDVAKRWSTGDDRGPLSQSTGTKEQDMNHFSGQFRSARMADRT